MATQFGVYSPARLSLLAAAAALLLAPVAGSAPSGVAQGVMAPVTAPAVASASAGKGSGGGGSAAAGGSGTTAAPSAPKAAAHGGSASRSLQACLIGPERVADLGAPSAGVVAALQVERGDSVARGAVLAQLRQEVEEAGVQAAAARASIDADIRAAEAGAQLARKKAQRASELVHEGFVASSMAEQAQAEQAVAEERLRQARGAQKVQREELGLSKAQLGQRSVRAPFAGVIVERFVNVGERVDDRPLLRLAALDPLRVELVLPATRWTTVATGDRLAITPELPNAEALTATVTRVDRIIDPASNTFRVTLSLPNPGHRVPAGARCQAEVMQAQAAPTAAPTAAAKPGAVAQPAVAAAARAPAGPGVAAVAAVPPVAGALTAPQAPPVLAPHANPVKAATFDSAAAPRVAQAAQAVPAAAEPAAEPSRPRLQRVALKPSAPQLRLDAPLVAQAGLQQAARSSKATVERAALGAGAHRVAALEAPAPQPAANPAAASARGPLWALWRAVWPASEAQARDPEPAVTVALAQPARLRSDPGSLPAAAGLQRTAWHGR